MKLNETRGLFLPIILEILITNRTRRLPAVLKHSFYCCLHHLKQYYYGVHVHKHKLLLIKRLLKLLLRDTNWNVLIFV